MARLEMFEEILLPHLDAAHNLARWLTRNDHDAQDIVQEAYLRAFRFFGGYRGGDGKAWLLEIVRNTWRTWQRRQGRGGVAEEFDEAAHSRGATAAGPEEMAANDQRMSLLRGCIND